MKRLATILEKTPVPGKKAVLTEFFFVLQGEEKEYKSSTVKFKLFDVQHKIIARDPVDPTKVTNETVFFERVEKGVEIPDRNGGNACGRTFPVWEGVKTFSAEERQKQKAKGGYYTFLFGEVTFPGKKPVLVNFRITPTQLGSYLEVQALLGRERAQWPANLLEIEVSGDKFAELEFKVVEKNLDISEDSVSEVIQQYIQEHNEEIKNAK